MDPKNATNQSPVTFCECYDHLPSVEIYYESPRHEIHIKKSVEKLIEFFEELSPFVQFLNFHAHLDGVKRKHMFSGEDNFSPPNSDFELKEKNIAPWIDVQRNTGTGNLVEKIAPETKITWLDSVTHLSFSKWLKQVASSQQDPSSEHILVMDLLVSQCSRAKLFDEDRWKGEKWFSLMTKNGSMHAVPIERREDGLWVSGPTIDPSIRYPAVSVDCYCEYAGGIRCSLLIMWSWWYERGHAEHSALEQALRRLVKKGWRANYIEEVGGVPVFDVT